jgi:hypothetical protein
MDLQKKWLPLILCLFLMLSLAVSLVPRGASVAQVATNVLADVPAFTWSYGCSATSAAMLFGYYDRIGYSNMYTGPENGGVCPLDNSCWGHTTWPGPFTCGECPLSASHNGIDGRTIRGHVDDYWVNYMQPGPDPWVGNWAEHTPQDCAGDYMETSQWKYGNLVQGNLDGGTSFWFDKTGAPWYDPTPSSGIIDGCHGMRLFAESRGYTVLTNFNQKIQGQGTDPTRGFTFADFQAEIDAGRPVLIHVTGHTMLGYGYDTSTNTIYIHNTSDYNQHTMTWGGTYSTPQGPLQHVAVTVIRLQAPNSVITINITAQVETVDDPDNILGGAINVGDTITGTYTYDPTTADSNAAPTVGDYDHTSSPFGITVNAGGFVFRTDPSNVEFLIEIVNDHGTPTATDNYLLRSYNNLPLQNGVIVEHISWQLDDPTCTALSSDALPTIPPVLTDWQSFFGLTLEGRDPADPPGSGYFIRAHVTTAELST